MRIDLVCPYAEKDAAKRLGARWDADKRVWYVVDPPDLLMFSKWLRAYPAQDAKAVCHKQKPKNRKAKQQKSRRIVDGDVFAVTGRPVVGGCGCNVLPWDDCEHTELAAHTAMMEMMA